VGVGLRLAGKSSELSVMVSVSLVFPDFAVMASPGCAVLVFAVAPTDDTAPSPAPPPGQNQRANAYADRGIYFLIGIPDLMRAQ
jgi:hypothetical protein